MGESLCQGLELAGWTTTWWRTGASAVAGIATALPDLVVCDIRLPDMTGEEVFRRVMGGPAPPPFIFMTAFAQMEQAISLVRAGAEDYLTKPFDFGLLLESARRVLAAHPPRDAEGSLGVSEQMRDVEVLLRRIGPRTLPVLLSGETGTGKDVCARFLHSVSRGRQPFMAVNCAAIPADLLESEVFGHERGAFTGAQQRHRGYAERAGAGTLFLDEIGEMPPGLQAKLLRVVEDRSFFRVGGQVALPLQARLVCATNQDLPEAIRSGRFREDLYYRINTLQVDLPPLRDRPADVAWLLAKFFDDFAAEDAGHIRGVGELAVQAARAHRWPGNVRELRNRVERAVALAVGPWLMPGDLFPEARAPVQPRSETLRPLAAVRDAAERQQIERALKESRGQIGEAAKALGVSRTTLWEKMRRHGFPDEKQGSDRPGR